jgi:CRISPR-associated protein Csd2
LDEKNNIRQHLTGNDPNFKTEKNTPEVVDKARAWMCQNFYDIRMFGAVMSTGVNCGQVRGPLQFTFARSIDPITPIDISITRMAVTKEEEKNKERTMGRKAIVPYGLYRSHLFFSPHQAQDTGVTEEDLKVFWDALIQMWEVDRSASRGMMACRGLYVFSHDNPLGLAPAHKLFSRLHIQRKDGVSTPRSFDDYAISLQQDALPEGIHLISLA